ncbi:MAG: hypothetical protein AAFQ53_11300, partial [Bacteroidota bacterium]
RRRHAPIAPPRHASPRSVRRARARRNRFGPPLHEPGRRSFDLKPSDRKRMRIRAAVVVANAQSLSGGHNHPNDRHFKAFLRWLHA